MPNIEIQTYLPNLYLKKFRFIQRLNSMRYGFPTVQNIQTNANQQYTRKLGTWDYVLKQVQKKVHFMAEKKKFKIAVNAFISKKCQRKVKRRELKKQEIYLFHRIISSHISQKILKKFQQIEVKQSLKVADKNKQKAIQIQKPLPKVQDDVFIDTQNNNQWSQNHNENNLFDEFFQQNNDQINQNQIKEEVQENVDTFIYNEIQIDGLGQQNKIKRKQFLKKIKQNLRKRHKYKQKNNTNSSKIGGAQIILSSLINAEPEQQSQEVPTIHKMISTTSINQQSQKKRRKKQQAFSILWNQETFEQMKSLNSNADRKQLKYENVNDLLTLFIRKDPKNQQYLKSFQKTIEHDKDFPKKLDQIEIQQPLPQKKYSETHYDNQYQEFIMKNQCQIDDIIKHFIEVSCYLFPDELDLSSKNHSIQIEARKLFTAGSILNSKTKMFKYQKQMVTIMDEQFMKQNNILKKLVICSEIFFLIENYLSKFGNKWDLIVQCLHFHPITRSMILNRSQIQNLHSYFNMKRQKNITFPDKLVLPYKSQFQVSEKNYKRNRQYEENIEIDLQNYDKYLNKACNQESYGSQQLTQYDLQYENFKNKTLNLGLSSQQNTFIDVVKKQYSNRVNNTLFQFKYLKEEKKYSQKKSDKFITAMEIKSNLPKNLKMNSIILKRRKIVSQKTSNLVNIFTKIRRPPNLYTIPNPAASYPNIKKIESTTSNVAMSQTQPPIIKAQNKIQIEKKLVVKDDLASNPSTVEKTVKIQDKITKKSQKVQKPEKAQDKNKSGQKQKKQKKQKDKDKDGNIKDGKDKEPKDKEKK